jgi:branched-chain amino acid transport system ATP-binding protein
MLRIESLADGLRRRVALDDVSFEVPESSITAVLGANGAGKSSLLRTVSGLVRPRSGRVLLSGRDITRAARRRSRAWASRTCPRAAASSPNCRSRRTSASAGCGGATPWRWARSTSCSARLRERRAQPASTLSGGERQMLVLGRALMARPRLLLLDEPSLGLAPRVARQIVALLRDLRERTGLTVLLVEQNARSALSVADRGVVLALGRIVAAETPEVLAGDDQLRHAYLGF